MFRALVVAAAFSCGPGAFAGTLLIENVTLIDGTGHPPVAAASVLIEGDRIRLVSRQAIFKMKLITGMTLRPDGLSW